MYERLLVPLDGSRLADRAALLGVVNTLYGLHPPMLSAEVLRVI